MSIWEMSVGTKSKGNVNDESLAKNLRNAGPFRVFTVLGFDDLSSLGPTDAHSDEDADGQG